MQTSLKISLKLLTLSILCLSIDVQSMDNSTKSKKSRSELKKELALWRLGGMALGGLVLGSIAYTATKDVPDLIYAINYDSGTQKFKTAAIVASIGSGAIIGSIASNISSRKNNQIIKNDILMWRLGGMLLGATSLGIAAHLVTKGMPIPIKDILDYKNSGKYIPTPFKASVCVSATGAGMIIGASVAHVSNDFDSDQQ